jgi:hypothetical protein
MVASKGIRNPPFAFAIEAKDEARRH